jgi:hypothetical protein
MKRSDKNRPLKDLKDGSRAVISSPESRLDVDARTLMPTNVAPSQADIVIIGTGFGATMTALMLADRLKSTNRKLLMIERGTWWTTPVSTVQDKNVKTRDFLTRKQQPVQVWSSQNHFMGLVDMFTRCLRRTADTNILTRVFPIFRNEDGLYNRCSQIVSTVKKSTASVLRRCARKNSRQVIPLRVPAGPRPTARSQVRTVVAETATPSPFSSPTMRWYPQPGVVSRETDEQRADLMADWTPPDSMRVHPTRRHQAPMPTKQRRGRDDEGSPAFPRQEPTRRREEEPVGPRHCWAAGSSKDGKFVPQHDDLEILEFVRPTAQDRQLQHPPKHHVPEREDHEASSVARQPAHSTPQPSDRLWSGPFGRRRTRFVHPVDDRPPHRTRHAGGPLVSHSHIGAIAPISRNAEDYCGSRGQLHN